MIKIISFDESYLENFVYNGVESETAEDFNIKEVIKNYSQIGKSWMIIEDEKLIGVGGIFSAFNELGQTWMFLNKIKQQHKKTIFKAIKSCMLEIIKKNNYKQIQTFCLEENQQANNLIQHLGYTKKELWRRYVI